jgi:head-tail adaptor
MHIAKLQHRVILCSQCDVVKSNGDLILNRGEVAEMWAMIEQKSGSGFSRQGAAMNESRAQQTHVTTVRYRWDLNVSLMAWIYEKRLKSPPRWFKVLKTGQTEHAGNAFQTFSCRLVERSDDAAEPTTEAEAGPVMHMPHGVKL